MPQAAPPGGQPAADMMETTLPGMEDIPEEQRRVLEMIAEPSYYGVRIPTGQTRDIIMQLCTGRRLAAEQLAALLNRDADSLRVRFLTPMVEAGLLAATPTHAAGPDEQTYTTAAPPE